MPKRVLDRSTSYESCVIDMHTGKPVPAETNPMICDRIRHYREGLGVEQKALAAMVGVTANAVSNWERGRARPDVNLLPDICEALQITLYQLYGLDLPSNIRRWKMRSWRITGSLRRDINTPSVPWLKISCRYSRRKAAAKSIN